jgi:hypothetical protein
MNSCTMLPLREYHVAVRSVLFEMIHMLLLWVLLMLLLSNMLMLSHGYLGCKG